MRAARPPGQAAMRLASSSTPATAAATTGTGMSACSLTPAALANSCHAHRPAMSPRGTPMRRAAPASAVACQAITRMICGRVRASSCASTVNPMKAASAAKIASATACGWMADCVVVTLLASVTMV